MFNDQFSLKKEFCSQLVMAGEQGVGGQGVDTCLLSIIQTNLRQLSNQPRTPTHLDGRFLRLR